MFASNKATLIDMGFTPNKAEKALHVTGNKGVEPALTWLLEHMDDPEPTIEELEKYNQNNSSTTPSSGEGASSEASKDSAEAKSIKCDQCDKLFKTNLEVEFHSLKSGHNQFSESLEEKKPLTDEEKKEQLRLLEEKLKEKRRLREEKEKQEALEKEKNRIHSGKAMSEAKKNMQDLEIKKMLELRKREKEEDKLARQRIKAQIEQDKLDRKLKAEGKTINECDLQPVSNTIVVPAKTPVKIDYSETKLQIRLTNGTTLTQNFGCKEQLSAVRLYIELNRTDGSEPFDLMTNFPKKIFTDNDYETPLEALDLVPSAVIIVQKKI